MVAPAFFLKVLALEGSAPVLDVCVSCGEEDADALVAFDLTEGGVLCRDCRRGRALSPDGLALLRRTLGGGLAGVLAEPRSAVTDEVDRPGHRGDGGPSRPPPPLRAVGTGVVTGPGRREGPHR